jgi:glycosyl transferase family 1
LSGARVCLVSLRGVNSHAAWCSNYEFEDVISEVDDVDRFVLTPAAGHSAKQWLASRVIWRPGLHLLTPHLNPGVQPITLKKDYDVFVFVCMNPNDLIYLSAIEGWKDRCKTKVCVMVEFYTGWIDEYRFHLELLRDFDHVGMCFSSSVDGLQKAVGRPCHHVPLGVDVMRYSPYPNPPARCVDVYSMGRRPDAVHAALQKVAAERSLFYIYDTIPGVLIRPRDHRQHRDLVAACAKRAHCFITYPAKVDTPDETRGQSEVGARFFEGAAAGAVLIGQAPTTPAFARDFNWRDAVVEIGTTDDSIASALSALSKAPDYRAALGRRNAVEAMRRFDWGYRWKQVLELAGVAPLPQLSQRLSRLARRATDTESAPLMEQLTFTTRA